MSLPLRFRVSPFLFEATGALIVFEWRCYFRGHLSIHPKEPSRIQSDRSLRNQPNRNTLAHELRSPVRPRSRHVQLGYWFNTGLAIAAVASCSRAEPSRAPADGSAPSADFANGLCSSADRVRLQPCRNGTRQLDSLPGCGIDLSHCPLDDCGSGGCTYDVYGVHAGCYDRLGSIHGAWVDVVVERADAGLMLRTWGRSGTTHVATEYDWSSGKLVQVRQFVCEYGSGQALGPECPKL